MPAAYCGRAAVATPPRGESGGSRLERQFAADRGRRVDERLGRRAAVAVAMPDEPDDAGLDAAMEVDDVDARVVFVEGEPRRDAHSDAGTDESLHGPVVVGAEPVVRRPTGRR